VKVADTNHESRGHKPSRHVEMFTTKSATSRDKLVRVALMESSPLQCAGKVGDKVCDKFMTKSRTCRGHKSLKLTTWFLSRTFMICVRNKSATLLGTCPGLRRKQCKQALL